MIVWGTKVRTKLMGTGRFVCPTEQIERDYEHESARKWFTLFWIPIIPMQELGESVRCSGCGSHLPTAVIAA